VIDYDNCDRKIPKRSNKIKILWQLQPQKALSGKHQRIYESEKAKIVVFNFRSVVLTINSGIETI